jgi:ribosomal protein L31E
MKRYTVNLGRARATGRKDRARKAVKILKEELERKEGSEVVLSREINQKIWKDGASKPPVKISVKIEEVSGKKKVYPVEEKERESKSVESSEEDDYTEIVSGTVSETKKTINDLDDPDYDALLEAEENGKDRKTLKDWIQAQNE